MITTTIFSRKNCPQRCCGFCYESRERVDQDVVMMTKRSDDVVAPVSNDKLDYYCFVTSLSEAVEDSDTTDTYRKKMLPEGPVKGTFVTHRMFVEFSKAANRMTIRWMPRSAWTFCMH
jgi:hypothetical protein